MDLQSDLDPRCFTKMLLNYYSSRQKQTTFVVISALKVKILAPLVLGHCGEN